MNFDELGAALRTERERRGLRIEDVADHLKINARQLRALEEGDAAALPHPAYARGFIRSYAAYLGISPDEIHNALNGAPSPEPAPQAPVHLSEPAPRGQRTGRGSGGGKGALLILLLLLVGAGAYAVWHWGLPLLSVLEKPRLAQPSPPLGSAQPGPVADAGKMQAAPSRDAEKARAAQPAPAPAPAPTPQRQVVPRQEEPRTAVSQPGGRAANAPEQQAAQAVASGAQPAPQAQAGAATPPPAMREEARAQAAGTGAAPGSASGEEAAVPGQHKVIITATEECWIHSNADKTDTRQFSLRKGDTFALTFARSLELKLGNAGGVRIRYDGQAMPPAGQSGQVRTVTFPPQDAR